MRYAFALFAIGCVQPVQVLGANDAGDAGADAGSPLEFGPAREILAAEDPCVTEDELELFASSADDIVIANRASAGDPWGPLVPIYEISSDTIETDPSVSLDGLTMIFTSYRDGGEGDLFYCERADRSSPWSTPIRIAELSSPAPECCAVQNAERTLVLFASERAGNMDIYRSERADSSSRWSAPAIVAELSTTFHELPSQWRGDRLTFDSDRAMRGRDVYVARYGPTGGLLELRPVDSINAPGDDRNAWFSIDERRVYFQSDRSGAQAIYFAEH